MYVKYSKKSARIEKWQFHLFFDEKKLLTSHTYLLKNFNYSEKR